MKLHFEGNLDYQLQAIDAVCDLFRGQELCRTEFTVTKSALGALFLPGEESDLGVGNRLTLLDDQILENLREVQLRNGLAQASVLGSPDFTVEMETGTGKTYVYLRTIYELNKRYGFTKFVIVVPSIAIKEGVYKSLQITHDHLRALYGGVPVEYFIYDSSKLGQVRNFATSSQIQVMIATVGAINKKDVNNLYKDSEKTGGEKPIDLIRATRPIIIVDEPQSVDGGLAGSGKQALQAMNPLCTLRYSATHENKFNMVYKLDAIDAYERKLVKQIEVAAATIEHAHNKPYLRVIKVENKRGFISARVEIDVQTKAGVRRQEMVVQDGDNLEQTTGRNVYEHHRIGEISVAKGKEFVELRLPGSQLFLAVGESCGGVDEMAVEQQMIRRTILEHLEKEKRLRPQGIKVLSLFFIDSVEKYRKYDADGNPIKGEYARIFEDEYRRAASLPDYRTLFNDVDLESTAAQVHNGYFSIDKKGGWTDTEDSNQSGRDNAERAYSLIMKEKEKLLSFETSLEFIFSHSALREGWDNPNVFQICALREMGSEQQRRQTIGRGLRLCVNQAGERLRGFEVNTLTVVARESYQSFAESLQREIEKETGIRFGVVEQHQFACLALTGTDGTISTLGAAQSKAVWQHLQSCGYIDKKGNVTDALRVALKTDQLQLPPEVDAYKEPITAMLKKLTGGLDIKNADERRTLRTRPAVLDSPEFKALWERIKYKTTYRVHFDNDKLIDDCINALADAPPVPKVQLKWQRAQLVLGASGVETRHKSDGGSVALHETDVVLPDLLTELQDRTQLTRHTLYTILIRSQRLNDFKTNPQKFIEIAAEAINRRKRLSIVDGVKYQRLGDEHYYAQELFRQEELTGYLRNLIKSEKSVFESVVYDSDTERSFADDLEKNEAIKVYAKLPGWFQVPTPLGSYNPDWAVLVEKEGEERVYFVVETKSGLFLDDLRESERGKVTCGKAHFGALSRDKGASHFVKARCVDDIVQEASSMSI